MTTTEGADILTALENIVLRSASALDGAEVDVARRLAKRGVFFIGDNGAVRSRAGGTPESLLDQMRDDPTCAHLFRKPDEPTAPATPIGKPSGPRPSASERLAHANGHEPDFR